MPGSPTLSASDERTTTTPSESPRPEPDEAELCASIKYIRSEKQRAVLDTCHRCRSIESDWPCSVWIYESGKTCIALAVDLWRDGNWIECDSVDYDEIDAAVSEAVSMEIEHGGPALAATERYGFGYLGASQPVPDEVDSPAWERREGETPDDHIRRVGDGYVSKL